MILRMKIMFLSPNLTAILQVDEDEDDERLIKAAEKERSAPPPR